MMFYQIDGAVENVFVETRQFRLDRVLRLLVDAVDLRLLLAAVLRVDESLVGSFGDQQDVFFAVKIAF
jgi:hypothetical protein